MGCYILRVLPKDGKKIWSDSIRKTRRKKYMTSGTTRAKCSARLHYSHMKIDQLDKESRSYYLKSKTPNQDPTRTTVWKQIARDD